MSYCWQSSWFNNIKFNYSFDHLKTLQVNVIGDLFSLVLLCSVILGTYFQYECDCFTILCYIFDNYIYKL